MQYAGALIVCRNCLLSYFLKYNKNKFRLYFVFSKHYSKKHSRSHFDEIFLKRIIVSFNEKTLKNIKFHILISTGKYYLCLLNRKFSENFKKYLS